MHTVSGGWGPLKNDWVCPGHEIVGKVIAVGSEAADEFKVGSIAGVGAQVESCLECERCKGDNENYCPEQHDTYNDTNAAGDVLQGGYSTHIRADKRELPSLERGFLMSSPPTLYTDNKRILRLTP
jgi:alcohol dehydrogenase (NADP+)